MTSAELPIKHGTDLIPAYELDPLQYFRKEETHATLEAATQRYSERLDTVDTSTELIENPDTIDVESGHTLKHRMLGKIVVPATIVAVAFQQSPLNETFRANRTFEVLAETGSPLLAGLTTLGWTIPIEGVAGATISAGLLSQRNKIQPFLERRIRKGSDDENTDKDELAEQLSVDDATTSKEDIKVSKKASSFLVDAGITCSIGPGMVVAKRHIESSDRTFRKDMETLFGFTTLGAGVSGAIGYLATGGIEHADKVGMKAPAEWFAENAADWKFWTVALGAGYLTKATVTKAKKLLK